MLREERVTFSVFTSMKAQLIEQLLKPNLHSLALAFIKAIETLLKIPLGSSLLRKQHLRLRSSLKFYYSFRKVLIRLQLQQKVD